MPLMPKCLNPLMEKITQTHQRENQGPVQGQTVFVRIKYKAV